MRTQFRNVTARLKVLVDKPVEAATGMAILAVLIAIIGYTFLYGWGSLKILVSDFYAGAASEVMGIALTVLIIDMLNARRAKLEQKRSAIRQMGSQSQAFALDAVSQLKHGGWLFDGSLRGVDLTRCNLEDAELMGANLQGVGLFAANLKNALLSKANLEDASLALANLEGAELCEGNFRNARFMAAKLGGADLLLANLEGANFTGADLTNTLLARASLHGAVLNTKKIDGANFEEARYNSKTIWPQNFDPQEAGAILDVGIE